MNKQPLNRTIYCQDNYKVLKGINNNSVDLIYLDPPFNSKQDYKGTHRTMAQQAEFKDSWSEDDLNVEWWFEIKKKHTKLYSYLSTVDDFGSEDKQAYLVMMAIRVLEMKRILKPTGSIFYHCDHSMSHYIKVMLDIIFGANQFRNEIIWKYKTWMSKVKDHFPRKHDIIFFYAKGKNIINSGFDDNIEETIDYRRWKKYFRADNCIYADNYPKQDSRFISRMLVQEPKGNELLFKGKGFAVGSVWDIKAVDPKSKEKIGYPTQKPLELLKKIIEAATNPGDMVLDPFSGGGTALVAAEALRRRWIGIDVWSGCHDLIDQRMVKEFGIFSEPINKWIKPAKRTDNDPKPLNTKRKRKYVPDEIKEAVYTRDNGACVTCGDKEQLQYDHIIPFSKGGSDEIDNLQILCRSCNLAKSNKYHS